MRNHVILNVNFYHYNTVSWNTSPVYVEMLHSEACSEGRILLFTLEIYKILTEVFSTHSSRCIINSIFRLRFTSGQWMKKIILAFFCTQKNLLMLVKLLIYCWVSTVKKIKSRSLTNKCFHSSAIYMKIARKILLKQYLFSIKNSTVSKGIKISRFKLCGMYIRSVH